MGLPSPIFLIPIVLFAIGVGILALRDLSQQPQGWRRLWDATKQCLGTIWVVLDLISTFF